MVMDNPFYRTSYPHGGFFRQSTPSLSPAPSSSQPKKVVSIPIRFVGSEKSKSDSALKIQKAFRGFRVRKNINKILAIQREIDLVENNLQERETVELIKRDDRERLKMNESLMALLIKLDSVRSVNDTVRDCRKAAIKKAIMLQERIDSFVADAIDDVVKDSDEVATGTIDSAVNEGDMKENTEDSVVTQADIPDYVDDSGIARVEIPESVNNSGVVGVEITEKFEQPEPEPAPEAWECIRGVGGEETEERSVGGERCEGGKRCGDEWLVVGGDAEESKRSKLMEKIAEDNQKLMAMMEELCNRNAVQASLISSLAQRVEHLENAISDTLRKKKKKKNLNSLTHT